MSNRLVDEKSPYLQQHADNPVDWYPWGEEAFSKALEEDKPVFLSIGYATCHWCHVMAHESFEDEQVAKLLNEHVVSIKVDREERPDLDHVYMTVCQTLTGGGGWPMSVFMTPEKKPFFAGTYFPKSSRMGMPGFTDIILQVGRLWKNEREKLIDTGDRIVEALQPRKSAASGSSAGLKTLEDAYLQIERSFDPTWGGFGGAPKFPTPHRLTFLLRRLLRNPDSRAELMVEKTLDSMREGGIFDHLGFGFHRYSVDERWFVPHFEKMLYDQAMLAMAYTEAFQAMGKERFGLVAREIFDYVLRDMTRPDGGFYSAEDADSEGVEGLYYVWTPSEVENVLGREAGDVFRRFFDIVEEGNFEERRSIPHITRRAEIYAPRFGMTPEELTNLLEDGRKKLLAAREQRVRPLKDDKVLTSWNGLMIAALAKGYQAFQGPEYLRAASAAADFVLNAMRDDSGKLLRRYRHGDTAVHGFADDYAFLIWGLIELYEASFRVAHLKRALELQTLMMDLFWDDEHGGFFYTARDGETLILRDREIYDGAIPSSNSVAALNLLRLGRMTGDTRWEEKADELIRAFSTLVSDYPSAYTQFLNAVDFALGPGREIVIAGDPAEESTRRMVEAAQKRFLPRGVLLLRSDDAEGDELKEVAPFVDALRPIGGKSTAYVCKGFACGTPVTDPGQFEALLEE